MTDQAGHLLEPVRLELHHRRGAEAVRLLASGDLLLIRQARFSDTPIESLHAAHLHVLENARRQQLLEA